MVKICFYMHNFVLKRGFRNKSEKSKLLTFSAISEAKFFEIVQPLAQKYIETILQEILS